MKLRNNGAAFIVKFNYVDHTIPNGDMEIRDNGLATHILKKARKYGNSVEKIGVTNIIEVEPIEAIVQTTAQLVAQPVVEEKKEEVKEKTTSEVTNAELKAMLEKAMDVEQKVTKKAKK